MKGYKAFNKDLSCRGYQYELDKTHIFEGEPKLCYSGFHFCTKLEDILEYYFSSDMRVFEIEANGAITEVEEYYSDRACSEIKLVRELSLDEVAKSITCYENAYRWAKDIGNKDIMVDTIKDSYQAYKWAIHIGNQDVVINKITDSEWAYYWAKNIGNRDIMIGKINEKLYVDKWLSLWPNDKQYFIDKGLI